MSASKKQSVLVFAILILLGLLLAGRKLGQPDVFFFQAVRDPNPWFVSYPWREFVRECFAKGEFPLWNPYSGLGEPFIANYQSAVFSVLREAFFLLPFRPTIVPLILLQLAFAGFGAWLFARRLKLSNASSFLCAAGFMLSGYLVQYLNNQHLAIDLLIPYGLIAGDRLVEKTGLKNFLLLLLVFALVLLGGQPSAAIFTIIFIFLYLIFKSAGARRFPTLPLAALAFALALSIALIQVLPFMESMPQSWTFHPPGYGFQHLDLKTLGGIIVPGIFGKISSYPFPVQATMPWFGEVISLLALVAIFNIRRLPREAAFFIAVGLAGMGIVYGLPGFNLATKLPGLSRMTWFKYPQPVITFCAVLAAAMAFELVFKRKADGSSSGAPLVYLALIAVTLVFTIYNDRRLQIASVQFAFLVDLLLIIGLWSLKSRRVMGWVMIAIASFSPIVWHHLVDKTDFWENLEKADLSNFSELVRKNPRARFAAEPKVWMPFQMMMLPLYDTGINDPFISNRFVRLLGRLNKYRDDDELMTDFFAYHSLRFKESAFAQNASRLLSAGWFVRKNAPENGGGSWLPARPGLKQAHTFTALYGDGIYAVSLPNSLPRVFFPQTLYPVSSGEEAFARIFKIAALESQAVVEDLPKDTSARVFAQPQILSFKVHPGKIELEYSGDKKSFAVFSEQYFRGWRALVDGEETRIYETDYLLRGVFLLNGRHRLEMVYQPWGFRIGLWYGLSSLALVLLISGFSAGRTGRERLPASS